MRLLACIIVVAASLTAACGPSSRHTGDDDGIDAEVPECNEGTHRCNSSTYEVCAFGTWVTQEECPVACNETLGCVLCSPGNNVCQDGNVHSCTPAGQVGPETMACTGSNICQGGACVDACMDAAMKRSYTGCEYWAADLDNAVEVVGTPSGIFGCSLAAAGSVQRTLSVCTMGGTLAGLCDPPGNTCPSGFSCQSTSVCVLDAQHSPYAIVVSNPQARAVDVTVTAGSGQTFTKSIAAGQVLALQPQQNGVPDASLDGTALEHKAYKVVSTLPVVAYQFNPLDNANVFSNDASLLVPRAAFDIEYYAMSFATSNRRMPAPGNHNYHGYLSVVAWQDNTQVEITPTATVEASATQATIAAGTPTTFTLNAFDVLTLQAIAGGDLTGSKIKSVNATTTFGVFGGHEAMGFGEMMAPDATHTAGPCCADHIEEMMFPTSTWGKTFAIARSQSRGANEPDMLRIMAQKPGTMITFNPPVPGATCANLGPGQSCQVKIAVDTSLQSNEPILVGHYLESAIWQDPLFGNAIGEGDPSMAIAVPAEQYRTDYTVLVPAAYAKNFLTISAPSNGAVLVDGQPVTMTPFAGGAYRANRTMVAAEQHKISCPTTCGVLVYGYGDAVSYIFAGGLDLKQIVIN
ncbi:MAG: IgGFc-binding protein [Myxococcales bacterium]|nr:IgGFc-binding protein [Myxococcales bacterium]